MSEYHKIETLYVRDERTHRLVEPLVLKNRIYGCLRSWVWTEKIDGTNIRLTWRDGTLTIGGRTDNAQIHADLIKWIYANVQPVALAATFTDAAHVVLYGEGYGAGIQKGGGNYSPEKKLILFDVLIVDSDGKGWWLADENVRDIGAKLGLRVVPSFGEMSLEDATELVRDGLLSRAAVVAGTKAEGLIGRPVEALFDKKGHRLIVKLKTKDFAERRSEPVSTCTCWLGRDATFGDSAQRAACAVHGEHAPMAGTWAKDDPRRIFVEGAAWWHWARTGSTMWAHERDEAEEQAERRYPIEAEGEPRAVAAVDPVASSSHGMATRE